MVIGMNAIRAQLSAHELRGAVCNDLIGVHVVAGAGTRLDGIHHELVIPFPVDDFLRSPDDRVGAVIVEQRRV
jgi:hypothetical protein